MYRPGDIHRAELRDIPGAGPWTIHETTLILDESPRDDHVRLVLALGYNPDPNGPSAHTTYALGSIYHGERVLRQSVVPEPGPAAVTLGPVIGRHHDAAELDAMVDAVWSQLSDLMPDLIPGGPLGEDALGRLGKAAQQLADRREAVREALRERDELIRRFAAGRVEPATLARVDKSHVSQLIK
ncbi:hypothetical protein GCM10010430_03330 [Kitasatospora cystarginea]|uniref:Uncharacterized protein n=2 Tax=Kitasatospora cystarginea TaxID=58350 RepID=A0ABN3DCC1_9ACTN